MVKLGKTEARYAKNPEDSVKVLVNTAAVWVAWQKFHNVAFRIPSSERPARSPRAVMLFQNHLTP